MCLAIPIRVEALLGDDMARVTLSGVSKTVSIALVEDVAVGDYLLIHVGYALARLDPLEAERTLRAMREAALPAESIGADLPGAEACRP
jgi:hydrogenase expression/formation protein HypC